MATSFLLRLGETARQGLTKQLERKESCSTLDETYSSDQSFSDESVESCEFLSTRKPCKGCLRIVSQESSLQQPYGSVESGRGADEDEDRSVQWSTIDFYYHAIQLGDNPVSYGHPVTIQWQAHDSQCISVDTYERCRPPRRTRKSMFLTGYLRQDRLVKAGFSQWDLEQARLDAETIRSQRQASVRDGMLRERMYKVYARFRERRERSICLNWSNRLATCTSRIPSLTQAFYTLVATRGGFLWSSSLAEASSNEPVVQHCDHSEETKGLVRSSGAAHHPVQMVDCSLKRG